jgi:hypothetical protein
LHHAQPNELRVFCGGAFHAQLVFNCSALPKFNTAPSKSTAASRTDRALTAPCVTKQRGSGRRAERLYATEREYEVPGIAAPSGRKPTALPTTSMAFESARTCAA